MEKRTTDSNERYLKAGDRAITSRRDRRRRRRLDARLERRPRDGVRRNREAAVVDRRRKSGDDRLAVANDGRRR